MNRNVAVLLIGGDSRTENSAMINTTIDVANDSRMMRDKEIETARGNGIAASTMIAIDRCRRVAHPLFILTAGQAEESSRKGAARRCHKSRAVEERTQGVTVEYDAQRTEIGRRAHLDS